MATVLNDLNVNSFNAISAMSGLATKFEPPIETPATIDGYVAPQRAIMNVFDINKWYKSEAYTQLLNFIKLLNRAVRSIPTTSSVDTSAYEQKLIDMLDTFESWIDEFPPVHMSEQRYGNKAFAKWHAKLIEQLKTIVADLLDVRTYAASIELCAYLIDAFGNATRIDYGSGHEAAFLIFLMCLYELKLLEHPRNDVAIALRVFNRYLLLVRKLQATYRMEPAGSRGVHALDDFQFCPYILGSSQLIKNRSRLVPDDYLNADQVRTYQHDNMLFEAVQYVNENKTGPFYEHSNQLYNISAVPSWDKINTGLFRMYEGEVLKKFPVVQHFVFGSLFRICERDPETLPALAIEDELQSSDTVDEQNAATAHLEMIAE